MGAPVLNGPFTMPMFRSFVPKKMQPWIYVVFAFMFQISGGVYLGALNEMVGGHSLLREDLQMCLYSNLAGMAIFFALPNEVPLHQQDPAHRLGTRHTRVQPGGSLHHLPAAALGRMLH